MRDSERVAAQFESAGLSRPNDWMGLPAAVAAAGGTAPPPAAAMGGAAAGVVTAKE